MIAMGVADVCRRLTDRLWPAVVVAPIAIAACAGLAGLWHLGAITLLMIRELHPGAGWPRPCALAAGL